jgi:hypothetical protein
MAEFNIIKKRISDKIGAKKFLLNRSLLLLSDLQVIIKEFKSFVEVDHYIIYNPFKNN